MADFYAALGAILAVINTGLLITTFVQVRVIKHATNSLTDRLVESRGAEMLAKGEAKGRADQRADDGNV